MTTLSDAIAHYTPHIDAFLDRMIRSEEQVENLHDVMLYALGLDIADASRRGKRLRPVLCMIAAERLGGDPADALPFAAAIELFHNFALVHDDIEDGDSMRRGRACVYVRFGLAHGVNSGDYFLCKVLATMAREGKWGAHLRLRLLELLSEALDHTHVGQALDINARASRDFTVENYMRVVREKTGYYLAAPILGGAMIAGAAENVLDALRKFGHAAGPLFQITDDLIDLTEGKGRGVRGSDIREGKRSFLVAAASAACKPEEREQLYEILDRPRAQTTDADVLWVETLFRRVGAFEVAARCCDDLRAQALEALQPVPAGLRAVLTEAAELMMARRN